jgi:hypothetical protein
VKAIILLLLPALLRAQDPSADKPRSDTAGDMLSNCRTIAEAQTHDRVVSFARTYESGICWGAFATLQRASAIGNESARLLSVCTPAESTRSQIVAVFVEYIDRRPERRHEDWFIVAWDALRAAFPCSPR